jgi:hypothetical protein
LPSYLIDLATVDYFCRAYHLGCRFCRSSAVKAGMPSPRSVKVWSMTTPACEPGQIRCIYCDGRRGDPKFSDEHIWPAALGGEACPADIFRTHQVCTSCNNIAGQWVDGAFFKSVFIQQEVALSALRYLDPTTPGVLPLIYMGFDAEIPLAEGMVCERWLGAAGAHIYHIHEKDDDRWAVFAGGDFIRRRMDAGRVYIAIASPSVYWARTALVSVVAHFPKAKRRSLTTFVGLETPGFLRPTESIAPEEAREIDFIFARPNLQNQHLPMQVDFSDRFLAKLSIGLAHTILGSTASASPYADKLRRLLWSRDASERSNLGVKGSSFWTAQDPIAAKALGWPGAWSIYLMAIQEGFAVNLCTPGGRMMTMSASDDPSLWPAHIGSSYGQGVVYVIVPQRSWAVGPIPFLHFVAHKEGSIRHPYLAGLDAMRIDPAQLPPMRPE